VADLDFVSWGRVHHTPRGNTHPHHEHNGSAQSDWFLAGSHSYLSYRPVVFPRTTVDDQQPCVVSLTGRQLAKAGQLRKVGEGVLLNK
jgi:hypothetical protein